MFPEEFGAVLYWPVFVVVLVLICCVGSVLSMLLEMVFVACGLGCLDLIITSERDYC